MMSERQVQPDHAGSGAVLGEEFGLYSWSDGKPVEGFQQRRDMVISAGCYWKGRVC